MKPSSKKRAERKESSITVKVRVTADAARESIVRTEKGVRVSVKEPAEGNRANVRVRALLAKEFDVPEKAVRLTLGHHAPSKTFVITL